MEINRKEVLRYLGYHCHKAEETVMILIDDCIEELQKCVSIKSIYNIFPLNLSGTSIQIGSHYKIESRNLSKNLLECNEIILFAATLGPQPDLLMKKYTKIDMTRAVIIQATAAAMIEQYCDTIQKKIEKELLEKKLFLRPRFSPGYGDFNINHQRDMISLLDCPRKIGLTVTDSMMLTPSKSVTAVMGISVKNKQCHIKGCEVCTKLDCEFRRD